MGGKYNLFGIFRQTSSNIVFRHCQLRRYTKLAMTENSVFHHCQLRLYTKLAMTEYGVCRNLTNLPEFTDVTFHWDAFRNVKINGYTSMFLGL